MNIKKILSILLLAPLLMSCGLGGSTSSSISSEKESETSSNNSSNHEGSSSDSESSEDFSSSESFENSENTSSENGSSSDDSNEENSSSEDTSNNDNTSENTSQDNTSGETSENLPPISYVQVFAPIKYTHVYAWLETNPTTELCGKWHGTNLQPYDDEYRTYSFLGYTDVWFIFNINAQNQTNDLHAPEAGYYWYDENTNKIVRNRPGTNTPDDDNKNPDIKPVECDSWKDFKFWDEYPVSHWTTINDYKGSRTDFRNESIYFAITTRFYDGDASNNAYCWDGLHIKDDPEWRGDFKGLIKQMDYIKALGFTSIWITPIAQNSSGLDYHGYHGLNLDKIDERYLSEDVSFQTVINEAHKRDMKIILDVVFNHTGNFGEENIFPMFYKEGDPNSIDCMKLHKDSPLDESYFNLIPEQQYDARIAAMKNTRNDGSDPKNIYHHYGNFGWESFGEQVAQIAGDCVDLNTENPIVAEYLVKTYGKFIRMGVDAFRIDTMKHISRLTFNNYITPALYEYARRCGNKDFFMFGEVCTRVREVWNRNIPALSAPFYTWKEEKEYPWGDVDKNMASIESAYEDNKEVNNERTSTNAFLSGINYHKGDYTNANGMGVIDFPMHWNFQYANEAFNLAKNTDQFYNDASYNVMYVDSHDYGPDGISTVRYNMGTEAWAENLSLMFTFRGIPCLYYGSEIEFQKGQIIDKGNLMPLSETGRAYYGDHLEGNVETSGFGEFTANGEVANTLNMPLAKHLQKLNKIRLAVPALRMGQYVASKPYVNGNMAFIRRYTKGNVDSLALVSVSGGASFAQIPNGTYVDLVSGDKKVVANGSLNIGNISKGNLRVYVLENASTGSLSQIGGNTTYLH